MPAAPQAMPAAPQAMPAAPQAMPAPAYDFVANAGMPQAQPAPVAPQGQPFNNIVNDRILY